jgi:riboflavin kinase/FMN adenylyltransferase
MLGYNYSVIGAVIEGDKRGRTIGFPTANIEVNDQYRQIPGNGVYTIQIDVIDDKLDDNLDNYFQAKKYFGMANIGFRPTFHNDQKLSIEVYIFDFNQDIYSKEVNVHFLHFLRPEQKFNGIEEIISQLNKDKENSLMFLKNNK